jgi:hypothetical protein
MKIEAPNPLRQPQRTGRTARPDAGGGFADALAGLGGETKSSASLGGTAPAGNLDALLALQSYDEGADRRRRARARGAGLLDLLEEVRRGVLAGSVPRDTLERLSALAGERRDDVDDPRLAALHDEIDLRAQVELAKLGQLPPEAGSD